MAKEEKEKKTSTKKAETKKTVEKKAAPKKVETPAKKTEAKKEAPKKKTTTAKKAAPKKENKTTIVQEENHYGRTLLAAVIIVAIFIGGFLIIKYQKDGTLLPQEKFVATKDEKRFKEEYESLNGTTRTNGEVLNKVAILDDNNINYIDLREAADILEAGDGVIYFGYAHDQLSRAAIPVLLEAMKSSKLDKIYYVNVKPGDDPEKDVRDTYILNERNKPKKYRDGHESYKNVLVSLANELDDYILYTDKGRKVNTAEKRLNTPTVVAVKKGVVVGFHEGTIKGHKVTDKETLKDLTKEEKTTLLNTYSEIIKSYLNSNCDENGEGC